MWSRALLALALVACGSSAPPVGPSNKAPAPSYAAALDDVLGFLPADSEIVVAVDAAQIRSTAVWTQIGPKVKKLLGDDLTDFRKSCGFDPMQTVERVSIGLRATEHDRLAGVVVVRGVGAGTLACLRTRYGQAGVATDDHGTVIMSHHGDRIRSAWTTVGSTLIVQIDKQVSHDSLQAVLASGSPLRTSHTFMELYGRLAHGASVWGFIDGKTKLLDEIDGTGMRPQLLEGTVTMSDRVVLAGRAMFQNADAAAKVDAQLKQVLAGAGKFAEHAESSVADRTVTVGLSITGAQLSTLLAFF